MKSKIILALVILLVLVSMMLIFFWGPGLRRSATERTPIPTLIPATLPAPRVQLQQLNYGKGECSITALDLVGAWVSAGKPENDLFGFTAVDGKKCYGRFTADILPLFNQPNIWYAGSIACVTCHGPEVDQSAGQMSLAAYTDILAGSHRKDSAVTGDDILSGSDGWEKARLYIMIATLQMPPGRPKGSPPKGPIVHVGVVAH